MSELNVSTIEADRVTVIEVFADVRCPFTHVGLRRFIDRREALGRGDVMLRVRAWPLELVNGEPLDPQFIAEEVDEIRSQVAPDLFSGFDVRRFPPTSMPAFMLAATAYEHSLGAGERVSLALRDALFEEARDIASPAVLRDIAGATGVRPAGEGVRRRVLDDWEEGRVRSVIGSPHYFVGDTGFFCPALDITRAEGHLRISPDPETFEAFLGQCFAGSVGGSPAAI